MKRYLSLVFAAVWLLLAMGCGDTAATPSSGESQSPGPEVRDAGMEGPSEKGTDAPDWGITLTAEDVTAGSVNLFFVRSGGNPTGKLYTGEYFCLEAWDGENWNEVEILPQERETVWWKDIVQNPYKIPMEGETIWTINWEWLYGRLPLGTYRIGKEIMDLWDTGGYDKVMFYAEFAVDEAAAEKEPDDDWKSADLALEGKALEVVAEVISNGEWSDGSPDCIPDYSFTVDGEKYLYHSECGSLVHKVTDRSIRLSEEERGEINELLAGL